MIPRYARKEPEVDQHLDIERYRASISRLEGILSDISDTAGEVSLRRCPYKNAQDRCTAGFGCRNQSWTGPVADLAVCVGSDELDYRWAWQV